jgi:hypothetical protein
MACTYLVLCEKDWRLTQSQGLATNCSIAIQSWNMKPFLRCISLTRSAGRQDKGRDVQLGAGWLRSYLQCLPADAVNAFSPSQLDTHSCGRGDDIAWPSCIGATNVPCPQGTTDLIRTIPDAQEARGHASWRQKRNIGEDFTLGDRETFLIGWADHTGHRYRAERLVFATTRESTSLFVMRGSDHHIDLTSAVFRVSIQRRRETRKSTLRAAGPWSQEAAGFSMQSRI